MDRANLSRRPHLAAVVYAALGAMPTAAATAAEGAGFDEEILVVAPTPTGGFGIDPDKLPFTIQTADADALERAQSTDLTEFMNANIASVNINSAQNNPLQPDVQFRGYTASPLLGLPQGIAVYQNGARINEPLGDAVNWDLLPESAIDTLVLIGGSNPLFGLNTLGGALSIKMKNGFSFDHHAFEIYGGSWGRVATTLESGANNGTFGYYINLSYFDETGWRDDSHSDAANVFASLGYRGRATELDITLQYGDSELRGNGAAPEGLIEVDREAVFTAPDITKNDLRMLAFEAIHDFSRRIVLGASGFYRSNDTASFNGDASDFLACELGGGRFLIEGLEEAQLDGLGFDDEAICEDNVLGVADPDILEATLNGLLAAGAEAFEIDDLTDELTGSGVIIDEAVNNQSKRQQTAYGTDWQMTFLHDLFGRGNYLAVGFGYFRGEADFVSVTELAGMNPATRNTAGRGVGTFVAEGATDVSVSSETWSVYFLDAFELTGRLTLTVGGRFNDTHIELRDRSGERPELDGKHDFSRFNPSVGVTFDATDDLNVFAGYSESSRAPTPIELACNDGVFEIARDAAAARGEDPDDVAFECRLPNAFLADPPLEEVVAKSIELGLRGQLGPVRHRLGYFRTVNENDIIFQSTGRATGLFANVDETRREGVEAAFVASYGNLDGSLAYSYIRATFEDDFLVLSPNHAFADAGGRIRVRQGDRIPGIPDHQIKFGADYVLPWNIRAGGEVLYNSGQHLRGDESNQLEEIDGYAVVNLRASYTPNAHLDLFARVTNLFDAAYENFGLVGEPPGELLPDLANQSPRFLGAGAGRGVWVGVRVRVRL